MPDKKSALEQHRRHIANLKVTGDRSGIRKTFQKAAENQDVRVYKGTCTVCGRPFLPGFAVRCSVCTSSVFHPACFGTHVIMHHSPESVTVIMSETENEDVWEFVDADYEASDEDDTDGPRDTPGPGTVQTGDDVEEGEATIATSEPVTRDMRAVRTKKRQRSG